MAKNTKNNGNNSGKTTRPYFVIAIVEGDIRRGKSTTELCEKFNKTPEDIANLISRMLVLQTPVSVFYGLHVQFPEYSQEAIQKAHDDTPLVCLVYLLPCHRPWLLSLSYKYCS